MASPRSGPWRVIGIAKANRRVTLVAFNVLCIAYGADKKLFVDIVEKGFLPKRRAEGCETECEDLTFAMTKLISPHIDKRVARKFHAAWSRTVSARRARFTAQ
jgi:hypothetical protein